MIKGVPVSKRTVEEQSPVRAFLKKRKVIIAAEYLIIAILAIGTFFIVSRFTLFAPASSNKQSHSQNEQLRVNKKEHIDRIPSTKALQTATTLNPWGIAFDSFHQF